MTGPGPCFPSPSLRERILLAMRPGPITTVALVDRLGCSINAAQDNLHKLQNAGLVSGHAIDGYGWEYRLTQAGRSACPRWRELTVAAG